MSHGPSWGGGGGKQCDLTSSLGTWYAFLELPKRFLDEQTSLPKIQF